VPSESASAAQLAAVRIQRARALMDAHRFDLAVKELRGALAADAAHAEAHGLLGFLLAQTAKSDPVIREEAEREAREAVQLAPDWAYLHRLHGATLLNLDRPHEALDALQEALRLDPEDAHSHRLVARAERTLGSPAKALAAAEAGLAIDPENAHCANERMRALHDLGLWTEATAAAAELLRRNPESALAHTVLGHLLVEGDGDHRAALEHFRTALRISPDDEWARSGLVVALKMQFRGFRLLRRSGMAAVLFDVVLRASPRNRHVLPRAPRVSGRLRYRRLWGVALLCILTQGLYIAFWLVLTWGELRAARGDHMSGQRRVLQGTGVLLAWFVLLVVQTAARTSLNPAVLGETVAAFGWLPVAYALYRYQQLLVETVADHGLEGALAPWVVTTLLTAWSIIVIDIGLRVQDGHAIPLLTLGLVLCLVPLLRNQVVLNAAALSDPRYPGHPGKAAYRTIPP